MATLADKLANSVAAATGMTDIGNGLNTGNLAQTMNGFNRLTHGPTSLHYTEDQTLRRDQTIKSNTSFSGTDCTVIVQINSKMIVLANVETFSYSIFREKSPVRTLGRSQPKGFTAGGRTIAGSIVFIVFDQNPLAAVIKELDTTPRRTNQRFSSPVPDQIPAIDFMVLFENEYGSQAILKLYGVEIVQEGQTHSINDIYSENVMQYVAMDIDVMMEYDKIADFKNMMFAKQLSGQYVDQYLASMLDYQNKLQSQISDINNQLGTEASQRAERNIATLGIAAIPFFGINNDINTQEETLVKQKRDLLVELDSVNTQINAYQKKISGRNAQNGDGLIQHDNLKNANINTQPQGIS